MSNEVHVLCTEHTHQTKKNVCYLTRSCAVLVCGTQTIVNVFRMNVYGVCVLDVVFCHGVENVLVRKKLSNGYRVRLYEKHFGNELSPNKYTHRRT